MEMLQSNWLAHGKRSAIRARWFDLIDKMATFPRFSMLSKVFKEHLETQMYDQILGKILREATQYNLHLKSQRVKKIIIKLKV